MGWTDLVGLMRMGSHSDAIMLLINPLVSACLGGQILTVWKGLMGNQWWGCAYEQDMGKEGQGGESEKR